MKPVPHGEPYAGKLHVRFDEGAGLPDNKGRSALLYTLQTHGVFSSPAKVQPYVLPNGYTLPGGGMERIAPGHLDVPVRIINVLEY